MPLKQPWNPEILKHEAFHFENLLKDFTDLTIEIEKNNTYYHSSMINSLANDIVCDTESFVNSINKITNYNIRPILKLQNCDKCAEYYDSGEFVINGNDVINILSYHSIINQGVFEKKIFLFSYEDAIQQLKFSDEIKNKIELYIIEFLKEHAECKNIQINNSIRKLLPFI